MSEHVINKRKRCNQSDSQLPCDLCFCSNTPDNFASPCGGCRQIMSEFGNYWVIVTKPDGSYKQCTLTELLPNGFSKTDLEAGQTK